MNNKIIKINTIEKFHKIFGCGEVKHPLITLVNLSTFKIPKDFENQKIMTELYAISYKESCNAEILYGRTVYDFNKGHLNFIDINQILTINSIKEEKVTGWLLLFHPDLIRRSTLGKTIKNYNFFRYSMAESLHLSSSEKEVITKLTKDIEREILEKIDDSSHKIINTTLDLLLSYSERYYARQFIIRENLNKDILEGFEEYLEERMTIINLEKQGIPSVKECGEKMFLSPNYLSDLLKKESGKSTQEHIHYYLIEKAKNMLLSTNDGINEISSKLGFDYSDYFSKLFKKKVGMSPSKYRKTIN